jgi:hypothetical protein
MSGVFWEAVRWWRPPSVLASSLKPLRSRTALSRCRDIDLRKAPGRTCPPLSCSQERGLIGHIVACRCCQTNYPNSNENTKNLLSMLIKCLKNILLLDRRNTASSREQPEDLPRVGNFRQKNNSAEDGIDGTNGYFRRNSGCSAEQKISEFRSEPFRGRENNSEYRSVEQK